MAASSSRWCPTQEQVMILEEIYNKEGIKTPSAFQIQQITTHLSLYGKIEGKNVFYWFQNHKARERQKLRRKLMQSQKQLQLRLYHQQQPCWYHYSSTSSALAPFLQGRRSECVAYQDSYVACQPTIWPDISGKRVQRSLEQGHLLADMLSPHCSIGQASLRTLELFPLKSAHHNGYANHDKEPTSSSY